MIVWTAAQRWSARERALATATLLIDLVTLVVIVGFLVRLLTR